MKAKKPARKKFIRKTTTHKGVRKVAEAPTVVEKPVALSEQPLELPQPHDMQIAPVSTSAIGSQEAPSTGTHPAEPTPASTPADMTTPVADTTPVERKADESAPPSWSQPAKEQTEEPPARSHKKFLLFLVLLFVIAFLIGAAGFFLTDFTKKQEPAISEKQEEMKAEPTKEPVDRSAISFEVLNGSGLTGAAARASAKLEDLGYTVVKTGNADKQTYQTSILFVSEDVTDGEKEQLLSDLTESFRIASISGKLTDSTASARLILGKE